MEYGRKRIGLFLRFSKIGNSTLWLFCATLLALLLANSPWNEWYVALLEKKIVFQIGNVNLFSHKGEAMSLLSFVNEALMALFFFLVGLEIKQELVDGELSSLKKAAFPFAAALGGMLMPVLVFLLIVPEGLAQKGAAIPMATDIAFCLGILMALGKKVPLSWKIFLTTMAVVDDIGGIVVMALFYSKEISIIQLLLTLPLFALLYLGGRKRIFNQLFYLLIGFIIWLFFLESGVHAAIAGVLVAMTMPVLSFKEKEKNVKQVEFYLKKLKEDYSTEKTERIRNGFFTIEGIAKRGISPLQYSIRNFHHVVYYFVLPLFAFVNAGVCFSGVSLSDLSAGVSLSVFLGLFLGKILGVFSACWLFVKLSRFEMPEGLDMKSVFGMAVLGGVGFTVSLFIVNLAYGDMGEIGQVFLGQAKIGVLSASFVSGLIGFLYLRFLLRKKTYV